MTILVFYRRYCVSVTPLAIASLYYPIAVSCEKRCRRFTSIFFNPIGEYHSSHCAGLCSSVFLLGKPYDTFKKNLNR
jgi:hypothetical protein